MSFTKYPCAQLGEQITVLTKQDGSDVRSFEGMETSCKTMTFSFSIEDQNGNNIRFPSENSPDAVRSSSGWSCGTSDSPADVEMEDLDIGDNPQTATPVLSVGKKTFCLPPLSKLFLQKDEGDSVREMSQIINGQKGDSSHKLKSLMADGKINKADMKTFPKPNFSNIKSKMMSGASKPFKKSGAQVPKTSSSSVPQTNKDQSMDHVAQLKASAKTTSSTPANVKTTIAPKTMRSSTYQESGPTLKSTSSKTSKDASQEKKAPVNGISTTVTRPQTVSKGGSPNQGGKIKPAGDCRSTKEDTQGSESLKKNLNMSRSRSGPPSPARTGGSSAARPPTAKLQSSPSAASKLMSGTTANNDCNITDSTSPRVQLCSSEGGAQSRPAQFTASLTEPASKVPVKPKTQPKSSRPPQTNGPPKQDAGFKNMSSSSQSSVRSSCSLPKTPTARPVRPAATPTADKNKSRKTLWNQQPDLVPLESRLRSVEYCKTLCEKKNKIIQGLENMVRSNNRRFEAVAVVIKHLCAEQEEGMKQRRKLSQELIAMREDLVSSSLSCERLEQEKEELRAAFDGVLQKVQEQHRSDLSDLEEKLKTFYSTEWEKVHQTYQEEAEKCNALMKQQLEELRLKQEALKKELKENHIVEVDHLKQHFEESFKELKQSHEKEMETLSTTLKKSEETLYNQIRELITENNHLKEKLKAEEKRRKDLSERTQDSHNLYLEQELESLKVVLDIKNNQIHEQDKKLMQIHKLMERNVKLDECLKKLQQENEDLKARMDKHAALSKQLSTEQLLLQESLQKESSVNKRLSMENEELLWKLHNGDLSSPRKVSPSTSLTLQSPRNSVTFSSPPISPR